ARRNLAAVEPENSENCAHDIVAGSRKVLCNWAICSLTVPRSSTARSSVGAITRFKCRTPCGNTQIVLLRIVGHGLLVQAFATREVQIGVVADSESHFDPISERKHRLVFE